MKRTANARSHMKVVVREGIVEDKVKKLDRRGNGTALDRQAYEAGEQDVAPGESGS